MGYFQNIKLCFFLRIFWAKKGSIKTDIKLRILKGFEAPINLVICLFLMSKTMRKSNNVVKLRYKFFCKENVLIYGLLGFTLRESEIHFWHLHSCKTAENECHLTQESLLRCKVFHVAPKFFKKMAHLSKTLIVSFKWNAFGIRMMPTWELFFFRKWWGFYKQNKAYKNKMLSKIGNWPKFYKTISRLLITKTRNFKASRNSF